MSEKMRKAFRLVRNCNFIKSILFNFRVLPFKQAIKLPILVGWRTKIIGCKKGSVVIDSNTKPAMILLGITGSADLDYYNLSKNYLEIIDGTLRFLGGGVHIGRHFSILIRNSVLEAGKGFSCNNSCVFSCVNGVKLGEDSMFGGYVTLRDSDGHPTYERNESGVMNARPQSAPISIGKHVWVCSKNDILKGVTIADECVVGYGSLCT